MTDVNHDVTIEMQSPTIAIGERLRYAREAKKLSIADIATALRLTKHTIEYIENEQWSELHGRAYARGYFSNYVKFLGLPEDELLAAFNRDYTEPATQLLTHAVTNDKKSAWLPSVLIILILVIAWFSYQQWQYMQPVTVVDNTESKLAESSVSSSDVGSTAINSSIDALSESQKTIKELTPPTVAEDVLTIKSEQGIVPTDNPEIVIEDEVNTISVQNQDVVQEINTSDAVLETPSAISLEGVLDLRFSDDCWVEVRDANAKVLLSKVMKKDDSIVLMGQTPFNVQLGHASAVQVKFNDKVFDVSPYLQRGVARFTLGAAS